jgi:HD-GYP domain-containing protein (c-di-GMP phosphodiesterase class II)
VEQTPSKAAILSSLSQALDLVEGQVEGHAMRTCLISMRIAEDFGLSIEDREDLYFASVLKDSGCSNNSVRILKIFGGDELVSKRKVKFIDWASPVESLKFAILNTERNKPIGTKLRRMAANIGPPAAIMNEVTNARCTRGAFIAQKLNFRPNVATAILFLDEHWDGKGAPVGRKGEEIPLIARILCLAQTFDVFRSAYGLSAARDVIRKRSKKWFDPEVVAACNAIGDTDPLWTELDQENLSEVTSSKLPWLATAAMDTDVDRICEAFAMIIDAKSSFTAEHSERVTEYSVKLAQWFGYGQEQLQTLRRACLMHDIGKLGVSTSILEKPGKLDSAEFDQIKLHPKFSDIILRRIPTWEPLADIASAHHERLDGKGYWRGLDASHLNRDIRIATACDVFDALTATRPYRAAMPLEKAFEILDKDTGPAFDADCVAGLKELYGKEEIIHTVKAA